MKLLERTYILTFLSVIFLIILHINSTLPFVKRFINYDTIAYGPWWFTALMIAYFIYRFGTKKNLSRKFFYTSFAILVVLVIWAYYISFSMDIKTNGMFAILFMIPVEFALLISMIIIFEFRSHKELKKKHDKIFEKVEK